MNEERYAFRKALLELHKPNIGCPPYTVTESDYLLCDDFRIVLPEQTDAVVDTAVRDFSRYLLVSMDIQNAIVKRAKTYGNCLRIVYNKDLGDASGYMGYRLSVDGTTVLLEGYDSRGIAQGLYYLQDRMTLKKAPCIDRRTVSRKALFSPRFTHSPIGMFEFSDEALAQMAHRGYDAISLWITGLNLSLRGDYVDMATLCDRAEKFGIDVYFCLYVPHTAHPDDEGAEEFYDTLYGTILKACPKIKGFLLCGEANEFHSKDPLAGNAPRQANYIDNIPTGKCTPGWWPCNDYPAWVALIQRVAQKYRADIDVVFDSYNWGYAPLCYREALLNALPDGVSVLATWDMFEQYAVGDITEDTVDYSLATVGPSKYFVSEASCAHKRGLRMYTNANTAGRTWDFGTVPFEPFPYQWMKRYEALVAAHDNLGVVGINENIHYGFSPSFIGDLEKHMFFSGGESAEEYLNALLDRDFGKENRDTLQRALKIWSEAITHYPPTNEDQYGAFRIGPAYPLWLNNPDRGLNPLPENGKKPDEFNAMWGNVIYHSVYTPDIAGRNSLTGVRIYTEIREIETLHRMLSEGIEILETVAQPNAELCRLINLGKFMATHCVTVLHVKRLYILLQQLSIVGDKTAAEELLCQIEQLLQAERRNVLETIPLVNADSRLGYEPSMEYVCDEKALRWKLRQLEHELTITLPKMRQSNAL